MGPVGSKVYAAQEGEVIKAPHSGGGIDQVLTIKHPDGTYSRYLHQGYSGAVKVGDKVTGGQVVGSSGYRNDCRMARPQAPVPERVLAIIPASAGLILWAADVRETWAWVMSRPGESGSAAANAKKSPDEPPSFRAEKPLYAEANKYAELRFPNRRSLKIILLSAVRRSISSLVRMSTRISRGPEGHRNTHSATHSISRPSDTMSAMGRITGCKTRAMGAGASKGISALTSLKTPQHHMPEWDQNTTRQFFENWELQRRLHGGDDDRDALNENKPIDRSALNDNNSIHSTGKLDVKANAAARHRNELFTARTFSRTPNSSGRPR